MRIVAIALLAAPLGCKSGGVAPQGASEPPRPYELPTDGLDVSAFDFLAWIPSAQAEARKHFPDAELASVFAEGVTAEGLLDLAAGAEMRYSFVSPSATGPGCMVFVSVDDVIDVSFGRPGAPCAAPVRMPTCGGKQLLAKAVAAGVPVDNAWVRVWYGGRENDRWRIHSEDWRSEDTQVNLDDDCVSGVADR